MAKQLYTPQEAQARYAKLPQEVKTLLYSSEMLMVIRQIAQKYQLHVDQIGVLEDETSAVMLGFTQTKDFPSVLAESLHLDQAKADTVASDVNELLFTKIRDAMKKVYEQSAQEKPAETAKNPPAVEKSVVMPSKAATLSIPPIQTAPKLPTTPTPAPTLSTTPKPPPLPIAPAPAPAVVASPKPPTPPTTPLLHAADVMLKETTVSLPPKKPDAPAPTAPVNTGATPAAPKVEAPKPPIYKTDPYREPPE